MILEQDPCGCTWQRDDAWKPVLIEPCREHEAPESEELVSQALDRGDYFTAYVLGFKIAFEKVGG